MTERITAQMIGNSTINTIDTDLNQLSQTQEELSTQNKINQPSDDPYGAALTLSLNGQISAYNSYQGNVTQGTAWVETASSSLQSIQQEAQTVRNLGQQSAVSSGSSGTPSLAS